MSKEKEFIKMYFTSITKSELKRMLQGRIYQIKNCFQYIDEMKQEHQGMIDSLEKEIQQRQKDHTDTKEFYEINICDLDTILQWYS